MPSVVPPGRTVLRSDRELRLSAPSPVSVRSATTGGGRYHTQSSMNDRSLIVERRLQSDQLTPSIFLLHILHIDIHIYIIEHRKT